jgi:hypothetical protein
MWKTRSTDRCLSFPSQCNPSREDGDQREAAIAGPAGCASTEKPGPRTTPRENLIQKHASPLRPIWLLTEVFFWLAIELTRAR